MKFIFYNLIIFFIVSCKPLSESFIDPSIGFNGSFEHTKNGIPYNWLIYSNKTVPSAIFNHFIDTTSAQNGRSALTFLITTCGQEEGKNAPGFAKEIPIKKGDYKLSFWVKASTVDFIVKVGGVNAKTAQLEQNNFKRYNSKDWSKIALPIKINNNFNRLRIEISIQSPGTISFDNFDIKSIKDV